MSTPLVNHPGMWLRDDAAASLARLERDHGKRPVTSAGRTVAEQNAFLYRYAHPSGPQDRPPFLFAPAPSSGPNKSRHIDGKAIDVEDLTEANKKLYAEYGFLFLFEYDKVHLEYDPAHDKHIHDNEIPEGFNNMLALISTERGQYIALDGNVTAFGSPAERDAFLTKNKGVTTIVMADSTARKLAKK